MLLLMLNFSTTTIDAKFVLMILMSKFTTTVV